MGCAVIPEEEQLGSSKKCVTLLYLGSRVETWRKSWRGLLSD